MYPVSRLFFTLVRALFSERMMPDAICETTFRCRPWDIDMFGEMNNGRVLTLYDLGRFDLVIRSGLGLIFKKKKWGLVVAGSTVQYRKRIRMFDKVTIRTQVVGLKDRWIYVSQSMWVKNQPTSSVLLRTGITFKGQVIAVEELSRELNIVPWINESGGWIESWIESEAKRPWPPV